MINPPHILLIGPLPKPDANKVGGARVSFQQLTHYLLQQNYPYQLLETQPYARGWKKVLNPIQLLARFFLFIWQADIVWLNVSQRGTRLLAPLLYLLTKVFRKKYVFRPFGSSLQDDYQKYSSLQQYWFRKTALQADILFLQTHKSIVFFKPLSKNIKHLPTSRPLFKTAKSKHSFQRKFIFLGHIKPSKGIDEILAASQQLDDNYQIHLYGPIMDKKYEYLRTQPNSIYQGILEQDQVLGCLQNYDVLLLPTYFNGEGYPGAIIEAYSLGLPVITTNWRSIPEVVEDGKTGILIEPQCVEQLVAAIQSFYPQNHTVFSANARAYFHEYFEQGKVLARALEEVNKLSFDDA